MSSHEFSSSIPHDTSTFLRIPHNSSGRGIPKSMPSRTPSPAAGPREIRKPLKQYATVEDAASLIKNCQSIVVLTGAGVSTSVGIPDFRSKDGLYKTLRRQRFDDPQDLFEISTFAAEPLEFWSDVRPIVPKLRQGQKRTSTDRQNTVTDDTEDLPQYAYTHAFLRLLQYKNRLLTNYTQNIDGLELAAGIDPNKLICCHGNWETATCMTCGKKVSAKKYLPVVLDGNLPLCGCARSSTVPQRNEASTTSGSRSGNTRITRPRPVRDERDDFAYIDDESEAYDKSSKLPDRPTKPLKRGVARKKRKREEYEDETASDEDPSGLKPRKGLLKPDITFFHEKVADTFTPRLEADVPKMDLLLIIGTSLRVAPVNNVPFEIPRNVPQIWINKERCMRQGLRVDIELIGDCDLILEELCRRTKWSVNLENRKWRKGLTAAKRDRLDAKIGQKRIAKAETIVGAPTKPITNLMKEPHETEVNTTKRVEQDDKVSSQTLLQDEKIAFRPVDRTLMPTTSNSTAHAKQIIINKANTEKPSMVDHSSESQIVKADPLTSQPAKPPKSPLLARSKMDLPESKVVIELDLATDNRWYFREKS